MTNILEKPIEIIKGIGPKTLEQLNSLKIYTLKDIIFNIPIRIASSSELTSTLSDNEKVITTGIVATKIATQFYGRKLNKSFFNLQTNIGIIKVTFFNQLYLKKTIIEGQEVVVKGVYKKANNSITASNITLKKDDLSTNSSENKVEIFYPLRKGITANKYSKIVFAAMQLFINDKEFIDLVPKNFKGIWDLKKILYTLHFPENVVSFEKAKKMFAFHELLDYQLRLQLQNLQNKIKNESYNLKIKSEYICEFKKTLHFELTKAQNRVIEEIVSDLNSSYKMDRLLQGDVGSGKTVVAAALIYGVVKSGYQAAIMAPTEILSNQHFETFFDFFKNLDISIGLLTSNTPKKEKDKILSLLKSGELDLIVGTHSLIQEDVEFKNLKFAITDEQHRFGVNQRKSLGDKGEYVHNLMMTATPIPRSLAITLITDIKVSTIDELPAGRKKVHTYKATNKQFNKVINQITMELKKGRQGYVVCPLIEESEKLDLKNVEETYENIKNNLSSEYSVAILHGKMKPKEKDEIINKYLNNEINIIISTTVIEVGVNVPNATFMIIVDAHRFGLATLHQLRGRVGRSSHESFCILITDSKSERIDIMCLENDGFKISEFDLKNRGPGDFFGTKQSGLPSFKVADLINDTDLMYLAKQLAYKLIDVTDDKQKLMNYLGLNNIVY
ncbi:ATP-dependent DNA helicase RecG [Gemelliphila palaticanis]|uniref:ATP-dependent DNA helicase RecG n=1 Tax=Gemelliphila palaticanis TaxID=81950 RepID=A0ABX2T049_9BACL|nr:ATP-dependent DNA helicase RecG [Gemella palaticanis]MBF0715995.1 ATP-dependent DNA helicase RecG [Gemella palaticanis]NYS47925.1 ATP-dependent DNA helicase RecG [Gemella palaticanis]